MLLIHKSHSKHKLFLISITSILSIGTLLSFSALTYTPELSYAETISNKKSIKDIAYMQEMTPEICRSSVENETKRLEDSRDHNKYWVAKMRDGNCWMTQNLSYAPADSNLVTTWPFGYTVNQYRNPGLYVYTVPSEQTDCGNGNSTPNFASCEKWTNVQGWTASDDINFQNIVDPENKVYDSHYLAGYYYSWNAATANSAPDLIQNNTNAPASICPSGWQLPTSGRSRHPSLENHFILVNTSKSFARLFEAYGWVWDDRGFVSTALDGGTGYNIFEKPFYLVRNGIPSVDGGVQDGYIVNVGFEGRLWSSTVEDSYQAYLLNFANHLSPANSITRGYGYSVRCVNASTSDLGNNVEITVNPTITLDIANEVEIKKSSTNPSTTALPVLVASNQPYSVSISSTSPNMTSSTSSTSIPSKSGLLNTAENAWGVKLSTTSTYTQITTTPKLFYSSTSPESKTLLFDIGISTAPDIPNGEYSTDITITATQN